MHAEYNHETGRDATKRPDFQRQTQDGDPDRNEGQGDGAARRLLSAHKPLQADRAVDVIVLIGLPASGKTSFFQGRYAATHEHISKDLLPRHARQRGLLAAALAARRPVVVDNTNVSREARAEVIGIARAFGARVIGYYFDTPIRMCVARNARREGRGRVPNVAIFAAAKRLVVPSRDEGFDELYRVIPHDEGVTLEPLA